MSPVRSVNMAIKIASVTILMFFEAWGAILPWNGGLQTSLQYHPNMTSMRMLDNHGRLAEVYLTGRPQHFTNSVGGAENNVYFYLYTREYNSPFQLYKNDMPGLISSTFNPSRPTKIMIHGFWNGYNSDMEQLIKEAYLNTHDFNIVAVDWSDMSAGPWYVEAVFHTELVGKQVALMIDFLVSAGANISDFHLIGHSLGAHISGFASNHVTSGRIQRITGLDPALPLFWGRPSSRRLDPSDAEVVDCIHTCGGLLGFWDPHCSHDYYPNGGSPSQPGCRWDIGGACSHSRSFRFYSVSITTNFTAHSCATPNDIRSKSCNGPTGLMGHSAPYSKPGMYYLETESYYPYVKS